jgi:hypothetical protein
MARTYRASGLLLALLFTLFVAPTYAAAQETPAVQQGQQSGPSYKDPGTATRIAGLITGGGHVYAGETKKGLLLLGGSLGSVISGYMLTLAACSTDHLDTSCSLASLAPYVLGVLGAAGFWAYGVVDAPEAAKRANARNGYAALPVEPLLGVNARGQATVGLRLSVGN